MSHRDNVLTVLRGERMELFLRVAHPAKEINRLMNGGKARGSGSEEDEEERRRGSFHEGVSLEAKFAFSKGMEAFCKGGSEGRQVYKGVYLLNRVQWF